MKFIKNLDSGKELPEFHATYKISNSMMRTNLEIQDVDQRLEPFDSNRGTMDNVIENTLREGQEEIKKFDLKTTIFMAAVLSLVIGNLTLIYSLYGPEAIVSVALLTVIMLFLAVTIFVFSKSYVNKKH